MATKLKVIKSKSFEVKGVQHTHYTCAYKGRVFGVSTMRFEGELDSLVVAGDVLTISCDVELLKHTSTDQLTGEVRSFVDIVPKLDVLLASV